MKKNMQFIQGFTLIETVLYTALFSTLMSVAVISGYSLVLGGAEIEQSFIAMQEQKFINSKLSLFVNSSKEILLPALSQSGVILKAELLDGKVCSFDLSNMSILCEGEEPGFLVAPSTNILEAQFTNYPATSLSPKYINASYQLNGKLIQSNYYY